jgi:hypothetical protein
MITLSMIEALVAQLLENAALLSSCHIENSREGAAFAGKCRRSRATTKIIRWIVDSAFVFLICSHDVLSSSP